ncbi:MAG: phytase [Planctomycetes bacterium]|nr:phytase [Planctomycetota bacterium]
MDSVRHRRRFQTGLWLALAVSALASRVTADEPLTFAPTLSLRTPEAVDQDDACVWVHPEQPEKSLIIGSDKAAGRVFVYDLNGSVLQTLQISKPGNIDCRQGVVLNGNKTDLVVVNQRVNPTQLVVLRVDPASLQLQRVDDNCLTGPNYGGCLYHSRTSGQCYFFCTSEQGTVAQYELTGDSRGHVKTRPVRELRTGKCEGAVADDRHQVVYVADEATGVWRFSAEPDAPTEGQLIIRVGEHGLQGDVEGLAIVPGPENGQLLLVSDQGRSRFRAYRLNESPTFVGEFAVAGARNTDGIDVVAQPVGPKFPRGLFICHTDQTPRALLVVSWETIARDLWK